MSELTVLPSDAVLLDETREIIEVAIHRPLGKREWDAIYAGLIGIGRRSEIALIRANAKAYRRDVLGIPEDRA